MNTWPLHDAQTRLCELIQCAQDAGPQAITVQGEVVAMVLSCSEFERLAPRQSLAAFMRASPLFGLDEPDFERDHSLTRVDGMPACDGLPLR